MFVIPNIFGLISFSKSNKLVLTVAGKKVDEGNLIIVCKFVSVNNFFLILDFTPSPVIEPSGKTIAQRPLGLIVAT